jgi:hypothetical protein
MQRRPASRVPTLRVLSTCRRGGAPIEEKMAHMPVQEFAIVAIHVVLEPAIRR